MVIDLNCDMGESFGVWKMGDDAGVMPWVSSVNIACGFHAGDFMTIQRTVILAAEHGVAIGAHVSLPDLQGFGRREMALSPAEAHAATLYQIGALAAFAHAQGQRLHHVKPHGALYNMAAKDARLADAIAHAVRDLDPRLILVGLAGSALPHAGAQLGLVVAHEAFADRRYRADGLLTPRHEDGAVIHEVDAAVAQAIQIATQGRARTRDGKLVDIRADTLCVHGDRPDAAAFAHRLNEALHKAGVGIGRIAA
ncbi:LamB/YcsF family protein [Rudaea sp.]|uniref:LamB/YcsF family protein n=1 Tax=Rudaea sp. TaxID=2136325 RepID=UPI0037837D90